MSAGRVAITVCAFVVAGTIPGSGARVGAQEVTLFPKQNAPYSELFKVPPPKPAVKAPQIVIHEAQGVVHGSVHESPMPRIVCGIRVIEGDPEVDSRIVIPIPEGHGARIRVIGRPPCGRDSVVAPDRR
jgi:hypothetical protein